MITRDRIREELEHVPDDALDELYVLVRRFAEERAAPAGKPGALSRLRRIRIEGPEDFAANLDLYASGEKELASDPNAG